MNEEFKAKVRYLLETCKKVDEVTGCWLWTRNVDSTGYGRTSIHRKRYHAHRLSAYLYLGLDLNDWKLFACHRCNNRLCFNPDHLYLADNRQNQLDVWGGLCKRGHPLVGDNKRVNYSNGKISCRLCNNIMQIHRDERKKILKLAKKIS